MDYDDRRVLGAHGWRFIGIRPLTAKDAERQPIALEKLWRAPPHSGRGFERTQSERAALQRGA